MGLSASDSTAIDHASDLLGSLGQANYDLGQLCTYRVGGPAALYVRAQSMDELERVAETVAATGIRTLVIGRGSNLLVTDSGFPGLALQLGSEFSAVDLDLEQGSMSCGGATLLPIAARQSARSGLAGFEWAVGVPGSVGGGVRMNAGGHGSDMAASLVEVGRLNLVTGEVSDVVSKDLELSYRHSNISATDLVVSARFQLTDGDPQTCSDTLSEIVHWRRKNQPGGQNAGSVFRNPEGDSAGRLIDSCGLKGYSVRSARVSEKHANFIQADADGSADDVVAVLLAVRLRVYEETGIKLHAENLLIGFDDKVDDADQ